MNGEKSSCSSISLPPSLNPHRLRKLFDTSGGSLNNSIPSCAKLHVTDSCLGHFQLSSFDDYNLRLLSSYFGTAEAPDGYQIHSNITAQGFETSDKAESCLARLLHSILFSILPLSSAFPFDTSRLPSSDTSYLSFVDVRTIRSGGRPRNFSDLLN